MRRTWILLVLLLLTPLLAFPDALWQRAVDLYDQYDDLVPGSMEIRFDQYNGGGDLVSKDESQIDIFLGADGEVETRIVYARKDGEDVTAERREDPSSGALAFGGGMGGEGENDGEGFAGLQRSPFNPAEQANLELTDTGRVERIGGVRARRYEFELRTGRNSRNVGTAWLDSESGEPRRLEMTIAPLPPFVNSFSMVQEFARDADNRWVTGELRFSGQAGFLFFTRRVESRLVFSEYFRSP